MQPKARLPEVLAAADVHVVPLKRGLAWSSVPSKLYSILAAGRPIVASVDPGTEVARTVERAGAGLAVPPDDPEAFTKAIRRLLDDPGRGRRPWARSGRTLRRARGRHRRRSAAGLRGAVRPSCRDRTGLVGRRG